MRTIIAGSRTFTNYDLVVDTMNRLWFDNQEMMPCIRPTVVLCGGARGADALGKRWAEDEGVVIELHPARWEEFGRKAGYMRNVEMATQADALVAFWDGESQGTAHMIDEAKKHGLVIYVEEVSR